MVVPIKSLYEAHLTVRDLDRSIAFYRDALGLPLATVIPARNVAFFWVPKPETAMLGIWAVGTAPMSMKLHIAFTVDLPDVERSVGALRAAGITPHFNGTPIDEPIVLTWMPAASVYFDDPDGHALEFIAMLPDKPRPDQKIMSLSEWRSLKG
ncbi:VOC family protein [Thalassobaculum sp. OXR-137]|uniref:VOC family protein n=1 Tax=Thalassobaculum sp. OXR-137 TaxID=3100173 RepID=UPI002AC94D1F|nr:VOC family protein [Thalassobaculum sp. OXR-137]WPZ36353.1 VOC family protein [Thalassobaculum sp. OXR-137]